MIKIEFQNYHTNYRDQHVQDVWIMALALSLELYKRHDRQIRA